MLLFKEQQLKLHKMSSILFLLHKIKIENQLMPEGHLSGLGKVSLSILLIVNLNAA